jgi:hypothetical protein
MGRYGAPYRNQGYATLPVIDQSDASRTFIAQPKVFHLPLSSGACRLRLRRFSRPGETLGFDQEQFPLSEPQEGF